MKKTAAVMVILLLACVGALAEEPVSVTAYEDGGVYEFTGVISENAEGAEYLYKTEYGFLALSADGMYNYTYDTSREFEVGATDDFMISYKSLEGDTYTREISVKAGENAEGTAVREGLTTENASFATEHCYIRAENGIYTVTVKNWAIQYLSGGETLEEQFAVIENGAREVVFSVIIIGSNDKPTAQNANAEYAVGVDGTVTGKVEFGGGDGDITVTSGEAKYGEFTLNKGGTFSYKADENSPEIAALKIGETLTETIKYTARDKDGSTATGKITITIKGANKVPSFPEITVNIDEGSTDAFTINPFDYPHTLGDGTPEEHTLSYHMNTTTYGDFKINADKTVTYTPLKGETTHLGEGETAYDSMIFHFIDKDGDKAESLIYAVITGKDSKPAFGQTKHSFGETTSTIMLNYYSYLDSFGDGKISEHSFTIDFSNVPSYVKQKTDNGGGRFTLTLDTYDPALYLLKKGETKSFVVPVTIRDKDGDEATADITIEITGVDHAPNSSTVILEANEGDTDASVSLTENLTLGDGPFSAHKLTISKTPEGAAGSLSLVGTKAYYTPNTANPNIYEMTSSASYTEYYEITAEDADGDKFTFTLAARTHNVDNKPVAKSPAMTMEVGSASLTKTIDISLLIEKPGDGKFSDYKLTFDNPNGEYGSVSYSRGKITIAFTDDITKYSPSIFVDHFNFKISDTDSDDGYGSIEVRYEITP